MLLREFIVESKLRENFMKNHKTNSSHVSLDSFLNWQKKNSSWRSDQKMKMFGTLHHFISCFLKSCLAVKMCLKKSRMHCIPGLRKKKVNIVDHQSFYGHWTLLLFFIFEHRLILKSVLLWEEIIKYHP